MNPLYQYVTIWTSDRDGSGVIEGLDHPDLVGWRPAYGRRSYAVAPGQRARVVNWESHVEGGEVDKFEIRWVYVEVDHGDGVFKPEADKLWVAALVEIEGINPSGASYNPFFFKVRDEQGFEYNFAAFGKEPALKSGNDLKPGQKVKGWMTFEVLKTVKALTLIYTPGFLGEPVEVVLK